MGGGGDEGEVGGNRVTVLDDLSTGREENIAHLVGRRGFSVIRDGVENEQTVAIAVAGCDAVFHLASAVGVKLIVDQPVQTIQTIIRGTETVLDAAHRFGRPVLITSSSEVYGKGSRVPFSEGRRRGDGQHTAHPLVLRVREGD